MVRELAFKQENFLQGMYGSGLIPVPQVWNQELFPKVRVVFGGTGGDLMKFGPSGAPFFASVPNGKRQGGGMEGSCAYCLGAEFQEGLAEIGLIGITKEIRHRSDVKVFIALTFQVFQSTADHFF